jgi:hypothetical protein
LFAAGLTCAASATTRPVSEYQRVSVYQLYAHPERWDGKKIEVSGLAVRQFEDYGLYESMDELCSDHLVQKPVAIYVNWEDSNLERRIIRRGTFRGVFENKNGVVRPSGEILVSNAAPGPGPLKQAQLVKWEGPPQPNCGRD